MAKYILKRLGFMLVVIVILSLLMFLVYNMVPNDRAFAAAKAEQSTPSGKFLDFEELYLKYQRLYGTDAGVFVRYLRWIGVYPYYNGEFKGLLQGELGKSITYGQDVADLLREPMLNTIFINIFATILALGITIPLGIFCAVKRGSKRDIAVQVGTVVGYSVPGFILAILFIWLFAATLGWFPVSGMQTPGSDYTGAKQFFDRLYYMALPLIVMTVSSLGGMTRYVRASMIEALSMDCIRTARAKGLREKMVIYSHAWRNALVPIIALIISWFLGIFSGSLIIENMFGLNGLGKIYIQALNLNEHEVVLALQMFYVFIGLLGNLLIDLAYGFIDPRIRVNK